MGGPLQGSVSNEPPLAHAEDSWDPRTRCLSYRYNGRAILSMTIPGTAEPGYRRTSDGDLQSVPFVQQIYVTLDAVADVDVTFRLSPDALNMRPRRAGHEEAIRGQVGRPLTPGVHGLYDVTQDLLIEWHGAAWEWLDGALDTDSESSTARLRVTLGPMPWFVNIKPHYYRQHLGYPYHRPWAWRPRTEGVAGWCSWEAHRRDVTHDDIVRAAEFCGCHFGPYGMRYIQIDDGYETMPVPALSDRPMAESWLNTSEHFPHGHRGAVDVIRGADLEPGIWTCSAIINDAFAEAQPESLLRNQDGAFVMGTWAGYLPTCTPEMLAEHIRPLYEELRELGYSYLKIDGIRHLLYDGLQKAVAAGLMTNDDAEARFRAYLECVREGLGSEVFFLASWGVLSQVVGLADACRISMDANPTWAGVRMQMVESARWFHAQRILFINDPDHICARARIEWTRSVASLVSLTGGLFMLSDPLADYDPDRIYAIQRCLPPLPTFAGETGPLDTSYPAFTWTKLHGFAVPRENVVAAEDVSPEDALHMAGMYPTMHDAHPFASLWSFHIDHGGRAWYVVGRFATIPLEPSEVLFAALGLNAQTRYHVYDFWAGEYLGLQRERIALKGLPLGHCQILAFVPEAEHPQLIATTRHVSMDAVSVLDQRWDAAEGTLTFDLALVPDSVETYLVHAPAPWKFLDLDGDGCTFRAEVHALVHVTIVAQTTDAHVTLKFVR